MQGELLSTSLKWQQSPLRALASAALARFEQRRGRKPECSRAKAAHLSAPEGDRQAPAFGDGDEAAGTPGSTSSAACSSTSIHQEAIDANCCVSQ